MTCCFFLLASQLFSQSDSIILKPVAAVEVHFDFGKAELDSLARHTLDSLLQQFKPGDRCTITAHTDSIGSFDSNLKLSEKRALEVADYCKLHGVDAANLRLHYHGEAQPKTFNLTEEHRRMNRRATIELFRPLPAIKLEGIIKDPTTGNGIEADVLVHGKFFRDSVRSNSSGYFKTLVPQGEVLGVDVFAEGYFTQSTMLRALPAEMKPMEMTLHPALPGEKIDIPNLYFVGDKAILLKQSEPELPKILHFMKMNPSLKIQIAGHVNYPNQPPVSEDSFEFKLSVARAKLVYDYLVQNGISPDRLEYKGYGNWEMVYPRAVDEVEQAKNRRVEIRVLK